MDTSETYIKMRLGAIPDLGMGKPPNLPLSNDAVAWVDYTVFVDRLGNFYYSKVNLEPLGEELKACQLERQDQLQEMVNPNYLRGIISFDMLDTFFKWYKARKYNYLANFYSMEQLWLAFVEHEKYNKTWAGDEWITQDSTQGGHQPA